METDTQDVSTRLWVAEARGEFVKDIDFVADKDFDWLGCEQFYRCQSVKTCSMFYMNWQQAEDVYRKRKAEEHKAGSVRTVLHGSWDSTQTINHFNHGYVLFQFKPLASFAVNYKK